MSTAVASPPRPALDLHRHRRHNSPITSSPLTDGAFETNNLVPSSVIHISSLSDIPEEHTPRATDSSYSPVKYFNGNQSTSFDPEAQLKNFPLRWRDAFVPGFYNRPPFMIWLRHSWLDILTQLLCVLASGLVQFLAKPLMPRHFPLYIGVEKSEWGLKYGKPYLEEYITTGVIAVFAYVVPLVILLITGLWGVRDFWESNAAVRMTCYVLRIFPHYSAFLLCAESMKQGLTISGHGSELFYCDCSPSPDFYKMVYRRFTPSLPLSLPSRHSTTATRSRPSKRCHIVHGSCLYRKFEQVERSTDVISIRSFCHGICRLWVSGTVP